jgi:DHA2 family multidrug resistance protein
VTATAIAGTPPAAVRAPTNKWLVTISVTFGTLMGTIDSSIVNVAIPHLRGAVGANITEITWVSTGFVIATVIVMPLTAFLGRFFGQKNFYLFSLVLFLVGSALCGTARSLEALVAYRALQGIGAGALQPTEQAILRQTFPPEEQGMAMALFGMAVMIGPAVGPTLGGYIVDNYAWPWIFYINLPVGALGLFMVTRFVQEPEDIRAANREMAERQRKNLDWIGISLMCVGLASLQYFLEEGQADDWFASRTIVATAIIAAVSLTAFVIRELTAPVPAVDLSLFRDRVFLSGTLIGSLMFAMLLSNMFLLPLFMQELLGFTAMQSGLAMMPRVLVMMLATPIVGRFYNSVSPRLVVGFGVVLFSIGAYQMSHFTLETTSAGIISAILIQGVGFSCLFVPLTTVALSSIERKRLTDATGLNSLLRQVGGSAGLAVFATLLTRYAVEARASMAPHVTALRPEVAARLHGMTAALAGRGLDPERARQTAGGILGGIVARQSMVMSFEKLFLLSGILFLGVLPILVFLKAKPVTGPRPHIEME